DAWLHGMDPWVLARSLPDGAAYYVDLLYSKLWFSVGLCALLYVTLNGTPTEYRRFIWTTVAIYIVLGVCAATLVSSVGPLFYDRFYAGDRFAGLTAMLDANPYGATQKFYMDYLYSNQSLRIAAVGGGISAMPSIHVAIAVQI